MQLAIQNIEGGQRHQLQCFQPQERRNEQWTVDAFWEVEHPQRQQSPQEDQPGLSHKMNRSRKICLDVRRKNRTRHGSRPINPGSHGS